LRKTFADVRKKLQKKFFQSCDSSSSSSSSYDSSSDSDDGDGKSKMGATTNCEKVNNDKNGQNLEKQNKEEYYRGTKRC